MKRPTLESTKGSFKSFINFYPPVNGLTAKKLLEDFVEKKPKFKDIVIDNSDYFVKLAHQKVKYKEKGLERIFNE